jgi:hypothetical protein
MVEHIHRRGLAIAQGQVPILANHTSAKGNEKMQYCYTDHRHLGEHMKLP